MLVASTAGSATERALMHPGGPGSSTRRAAALDPAVFCETFPRDTRCGSRGHAVPLARLFPGVCSPAGMEVST